MSKLKAGTQLTQRYRCVEGNILLDEVPEYLPGQVSPLSAGVMPYLNLAPLAGRIPVPHTILTAESLLVDLTLPAEGLLLLEQAPLAHSETGIGLLPTLAAEWPGATGLRQLNWLRQVAELWSPLNGEGVAATLTNPSLLRVDGTWLRLLALEATASQEAPIALTALGISWQRLLPGAQPAIRDSLGSLIENLQAGKLTIAKDLRQRLESAVAALAGSQPVRVALATYTDQGPTRQRNEDACFPPSGTTTVIDLPAINDLQASTPDWVIVCDGIGGHEGGDVASHLAIETIGAQLKPLKQPGLSPGAIAQQIRQAILAANDIIYARNNQEHRQARGRMGTTLVMGVVYPPFLFIAHVGDSRAYRISASSCCQITLDDDVAARDTRLGLALYRDALRQPGAGSLIQALGITESKQLYPSIQWHLLDDRCTYLICSDGLSDYDRVEALWWS
ncbi:serine/threonine protein phosphatase, partial [filamentous cyanobacterium CCP5]